VDYQRFPGVAAAMLRDVFEIQAAGDRARAEAYIDRYSEWRDDLHERLAGAMRAAETFRFAYVTYAALASPVR
jgi:hypothetical protein